MKYNSIRLVYFTMNFKQIRRSNYIIYIDFYFISIATIK